MIGYVLQGYIYNIYMGFKSIKHGETNHMIELDDGWWVTRDHQTSQFTGDYDHP